MCHTGPKPCHSGPKACHSGPIFCGFGRMFRIFRISRRCNRPLDAVAFTSIKPRRACSIGQRPMVGRQEGHRYSSPRCQTATRTPLKCQFQQDAVGIKVCQLATSRPRSASLVDVLEALGIELPTKPIAFIDI